MAAMHENQASITAAKGGCYICTNPNDGVAFDAVIEGEGVLWICTGCLLDAADVAVDGRTKLRGPSWVSAWAGSAASL